MTSEILTSLEKLIEVVAKLRHPQEGCPWDLAQTPETLIPYILEEAYESVEAIQRGDKKAIAEELGDLLLQVVLQAQIASENNDFTMKEIAEGITEKLIRRHPHVFTDQKVNSIDEVHSNWQKIKAEEKGENPEIQQLLSKKLSKYHRTLPPLIAGMKISEKTAQVGLEWENIQEVWAKFHEELTEFQEALQTPDKEHQQAELGDLIFTIINLARWYELDPFLALQGTNQRVIQRIEKIEKYTDKPLGEYSLEELEALWQQAKIQLAKNSDQ
jgi:XTP/dITP diphosphohydrolase